MNKQTSVNERSVFDLRFIMKFFVHVSQSLVGDVGVDLRCRDRRMAKQCLYAANVGAVLEQVGGKAVAQCVRGYFFHHPGEVRVFFNDALH